MTDYKRFVSYIYSYDQGVKNKNVGFAKIEARNGQCKLMINIKGAYQANGKELVVYLFYRKEEKLVGLCIGPFAIKNGAGEFRDTVDSVNIKSSGHSLDEMAGILICDKDGKQNIYASGWDDNALQVNQFYTEEDSAILQVTELIFEKREQQKEAQQNIEKEKNEKKEEIEEIEEKEEEEEETLIVLEDTVAEVPIITGSDNEEQDEIEMPPVIEINQPKEEALEVLLEPAVTLEIEAENIQFAALEAKERVEEKENIIQAQEEIRGDCLWDRLCNQFPKVRAFENEPEIICLKIDLKDLENLPKENWILGNNSFLLHGYYNFRYLLLAMMDEEKCMLGIPGMYHNNERFMAAMFGFETFKPVLPCKQMTGQFGYWCRPIVL